MRRVLRECIVHRLDDLCGNVATQPEAMRGVPGPVPSRHGPLRAAARKARMASVSAETVPAITIKGDVSGESDLVEV